MTTIVGGRSRMGGLVLVGLVQLVALKGSRRRQLSISNAFDKLILKQLLL